MEVTPSQVNKPNIKGEISLTFNGQDAVLRPSFTAVTQLETIAGKSLLAIAKDMANGVPSVTDIARVLWVGLRAGRSLNPVTGREYTIDEIGEVIFKDGVASYFMVVGQFIGGVMSGGKSGQEAAPN